MLLFCYSGTILHQYYSVRLAFASNTDESFGRMPLQVEEYQPNLKWKNINPTSSVRVCGMITLRNVPVDCSPRPLHPRLAAIAATTADIICICLWGVVWCDVFCFSCLSVCFAVSSTPVFRRPPLILSAEAPLLHVAAAAVGGGGGGGGGVVRYLLVSSLHDLAMNSALRPREDAA